MNSHKKTFKLNFVQFRNFSPFFASRTPYDQNSTVGHVFSHITQTTGISSLVAYLCAITTTYFGVCSYFEALFFDLMCEHEKIDDEYMQQSIKTNLKAAAGMRRRFLELIDLHNTIL